MQGVQFAVWAPQAKGVAVVGDWNHWDGRQNPMRCLGNSGVWELFLPGVAVGAKYKFEVDGVLKRDPYAHQFELRPRDACVVVEVGRSEWVRPQGLDRPMRIYEVHLGSWRDFGAEFPNYREVGRDLAVYCKEMGFTHVELMPVMEHPLDESWGYQVTGFYAPTSRYGTPADFKAMVEVLHEAGIGVILDWVPAHFPMDAGALARFDGSALYEHEDPREGLHPHWGTAIFNYGRCEVVNFLLGSALFWLEVMGVDGLRVDAVASMLYRDYGRKSGEWIPNREGGNVNFEAMEFLKHLNAVVHKRCPGALMIAEESSAFPGVTHELGFDLKWNMGWMNDTLRYFARAPIHRKHHQNDLTFSLLYAFSERFALPFSHDEGVHGKGTLLSKMPGDDWQKFAHLRLLLSYQMCHPGKKLVFMGTELGQWREWNCKGRLDWHLLQYERHQGIYDFVRALNRFADLHPALWADDFSWDGYQWIDFSDADRSMIAYLRKGRGETLAIVHNFTPEVRRDYAWQVPLGRELFNSDAKEYGGSGLVSGPDLAPLATQVFEVLA